MCIGPGVDQLGIDADLVARPPEASFEHVRSLIVSSGSRCGVFCAAAAFPGTWGGNAGLESDLSVGSNVNRRIGARSLSGSRAAVVHRLMVRPVRPQAPEMPCAPLQLRLVPH